MDLTNRHDVEEWLDGAAKFFWSALFVSFTFASFVLGLYVSSLLIEKER